VNRVTPAPPGHKPERAARSGGPLAFPADAGCHFIAFWFTIDSAIRVSFSSAAFSSSSDW
jgi:hypothetical protein